MGCVCGSRLADCQKGMDKYMKRIPLWSVGVLLGIICVVIGALGDQFEELYRKAVMVCLECIGIG